MSFFGRNNQPPAQPQYGRLPAEPGLPSGPRQGTAMRPGGPQSMQYNAPPQGYNDPPNSNFDRRGYERSDRGHDQRGAPGYGGRPPAPPSRGGGGGHFNVTGTPGEALALTNCIIVHPSDLQHGQHVLVNDLYGMTVKHDNTGKIEPGTIGVAGPQRQWIGLSLAGDHVSISPLPSPPNPGAPLFLESIDIEIAFNRKGYENPTPYDPEAMTKQFTKVMNGVIMSTNESIIFDYQGQNIKGTVHGVSVLELPEEQRRGGGHSSREFGIIMDRTDVNFIKAPDSTMKIKSSAKKAPPNAIIAPNFKFEDMGIGGLDSEFGEIFRRAFSSRVFPPGLVEKLGIQHVKGILLHGPPGTGKTLIARQIGKMLNAREPKIVNGPEILNKYVGASEENIRKLFADAEKEYKEKGDESGLHIIIFDELDAIFKQRGSTNSGTGVGDTVVNQLLSKMDGVDQLNNILIIGMTNRKDMIDEALLRPGRLEVHMEISLPDEHGRFQILNIHTSKMRNNGVMERDVDLQELASLTKNFSGAEIGGLIKSATSFAFNRHVKVGTMAGFSDVENLRVNRGDFMNALEEVHPAFGVSEEELLQVIQNGIIRFDSVIDETLRSGQLFVEQVRTSTRTPLVSVLLHGPPGSGKTALAASIAQASEYPFIKLISPDTMVGFSESQKVTAITKIFSDSYKSPLSVIVVDNLERLLDWTPIGPRFSNPVLQTLLVLMARRPPKGKRLLVLATSSLRPVLTELGLSETFDSELRVPPISNLASLDYVLRNVKLFRSEEEMAEAMRMLEDAGFALKSGDDTTSRLHIGIKKLLSNIEMARQEPEYTAQRLTGALMGLGM